MGPDKTTVTYTQVKINDVVDFYYSNEVQGESGQFITKVMSHGHKSTWGDIDFLVRYGDAVHVCEGIYKYQYETLDPNPAYGKTYQSEMNDGALATPMSELGLDDASSGTNAYCLIQRYQIKTYINEVWEDYSESYPKLETRSGT